MAGTHFRDPISGNPRAWAGAGKDVPIQAINLDDWMVYTNDFITNADLDTSNDWTVTAITAGTVGFVADYNTGAIRLDCPANQQGPILQLDSVSAGVTPQAKVPGNVAASEAVFACRFRVRDAGASSFFVGLAESNATSAVLAGAGTMSSATHAGFHQQDPNTTSAGAINMVAAGDTNANQQSASVPFSLADDEWVDVAVRLVGTQNASFYARRADLVGARSRSPKPWVHLDDLTTTNAWDTVMYPTVALAGSGTGDDLDVDKIVLAVKRDLTIG